jgi:hypothetical protein
MPSRPIKDFIAEVKNGGLAKTSRFTVDFNLPASVQMRSSFGLDLRKILLFCDSAQLPGINLSTTQSRTFGEFRELPYEKLFDNVNLSFYVDTSMNVKLLFDSWMESIQDPETKTFEYYKNYTTDLIVGIYDTLENQRYQCTLYEAYPKSISAISLDYASRDVMKIQVTMMYRNYKTEQLVVGDTSNQFEQKKLFSINGKVPSDYFNNFGSFQGKYNDFNNTYQNGSLQVPSRNAATETNATIVDFT